eukprot:s78_g13.t1
MRWFRQRAQRAKEQRCSLYRRYMHLLDPRSTDIEECVLRGIARILTSRRTPKMLVEEAQPRLPNGPTLCGDMSKTVSHDWQRWFPSYLFKNAELLSGVVGGPLVVGLLTPQRNAMTLAAKDVHSSFFGLYRQVFQAGLLKAFRGGNESAGHEAQPQEQAAKDQERPGVPIAPTPSGQKETREEHMASEKHGLGHEELPEVQRPV